MLAEVLDEQPRTITPHPPPRTRTIRVGLLGLGNVGQAVARLAPEAQHLDTGGVRFTIASALVRDVTRPRRCPRPARITSNPEAFLRGHYDVVIEALGTIEPARTIVARQLGRGTPVVTANKALVAAHGAHLRALAARRGTTLRYEASALAGVPFLGALSARPYLAGVTRFTAVVNGTSNFILSTIDAERVDFDTAFARALQAGLTEPDPSRDLDGLDAADKFVLLASILGWGSYSHQDVDVRGIRDLRAADLDAARELGGTIKPIVSASHSPHALDAFVGPAFVPTGHPLASLAGTLSGIQLKGRYLSDLFFSGPGAGPDVTAATVLDDAVEAVSSQRRFAQRTRRLVASVPLRAPATAWLVRVEFPGALPDVSTAPALFATAGLSVLQATHARNSAQWLHVAPCPTDHVTRALLQIRRTHRIETLAVRSLRA